MSVLGSWEGVLTPWNFVSGTSAFLILVGGGPQESLCLEMPQDGAGQDQPCD